MNRSQRMAYRARLQQVVSRARDIRPAVGNRLRLDQVILCITYVLADIDSVNATLPELAGLEGSLPRATEGNISETEIPNSANRHVGQRDANLTHFETAASVVACNAKADKGSAVRISEPDSEVVFSRGEVTGDADDRSHGIFLSLDPCRFIERRIFGTESR